MSDEGAGIVPALKSMDGEPPSGLLHTATFHLKKKKLPPLDEQDLVAALTVPDLNDPARVRFQLLISRWDAVDPGETDWTEGTQPHTVERRQLVYRELELGEQSRQRLDAVFPRDPGAVVIEGSDGTWKPWYTPVRQTERDFYWKAYSGLLERSGWPAGQLGRLDTSTTSVVRRLADPTWDRRYQSKGLVVGYVQSGKTANFTGVVAKAIDAGYRLIIVLTGTVEILRRQTQRRLDMELVGVENILGGIDEKDHEKVAETDYHEDRDWLGGQFLRHNVAIHTVDDVPTIRRLSTYSGDYRRLQQGLSTLDFRAGHELADKSRPLYNSANLFRSDVRLAVVKKNSTVLKRLVEDLKEIHAELDEIPTLIIDDEADQASVNTRKQKKGAQTKEEKERSAVNQRISDLLQLLGRAQYVGYTATPFANVFIDPDDSVDLFPKDFIVSLERPDGYMGASDFHDLDVDYGDEPRTIENSNEKAYVRDLVAHTPETRRLEMQNALDAFVLSGAIKLYREAASGGNVTFRHHTMLVHASVKKADHADLADEIREIWKAAGYDTPAGLARLRAIFEKDFAPVAAARHRRKIAIAVKTGSPEPKALPIPATFDELAKDRRIGRTLDRIDRGVSPVIVVNGDSDKDYEQDALDFQTDEVWKILVGGAKLSRGFTVEGLTVSYYTRRTQQADTLMQMGRWFGFRHDYDDLVRLYIGRNVAAPGGKSMDLYEAFEAVVRDEEDFRDELVRYAAINDGDGHPQVRPEDVPPMVFQQVPWLKPTATNKMYNAELVQQGVGGKLHDFSQQADRGSGSGNAAHFSLVRPLLEKLTFSGQFGYVEKIPGGIDRTGYYDARYGIVNASLVRDIVAEFTWAPNWSFTPYLTFLDKIIAEGNLTEFIVLMPELDSSPHLKIGDFHREFPILIRKRREGRAGFSGSSKRQRDAIETIAGKRVDVARKDVLDTSGGPLAVELHTESRGAMLLTFALDAKDPDARPLELPQDRPVSPNDIATLFSYALPHAAAPKARIGFQARRVGAGAIIDRPKGSA